MNKRSIYALPALFFLALSAQAQDESPEQVITTAANELASDLATNGEQYKADPEALYAMIDGILSQIFDKRYAGARVLGGQVWRSATDQQKDDFVNALYWSLVKTYGDAVLDFNRDELEVIPARAAPDGDRATVKTQMQLADGTEVAVDYRLRLTGGKWLVYDVLVEGISYISNYHDEYAQKIKDEGLDAVIADLQSDPIKPEVKPQVDGDATKESQ